jgi:hypothetical protein
MVGRTSSDWVVGTPASCLEGTGFKYRPGDRLSALMFCFPSVFLGVFRQILGY